MKTRLLIALCILAVSRVGLAPTRASDEKDPVWVITDAVLVRPACFAVTAVGSVFFVVSYPIAAVSKSVKQTADTLVVKPAKMTFTRPLGDMDALTD